MSKKNKSDKKTEDKHIKSENKQTVEQNEKEQNTDTQTDVKNEESKEATWEDKYNEINDKYLRLSAEFDNYRKRTLKERMDLMKTAGEDILKNLLPVIDNIERAEQSVNDAKDIDAVKEGISLIKKNFINFTEQRGIKEIEAMGQEFDTDLHEALTKIPAPDETLKGKVVDVIEKGYTLNDKVIRFAKVVVGE